VLKREKGALSRNPRDDAKGESLSQIRMTLIFPHHPERHIYPIYIRWLCCRRRGPLVLPAVRIYLKLNFSLGHSKQGRRKRWGSWVPLAAIPRQPLGRLGAWALGRAAITPGSAVQRLGKRDGCDRGGRRRRLPTSSLCLKNWRKWMRMPRETIS